MLSGVAGSGKTTALCARARYLRQRHPSWRILVVCFNGSLANHLRRTLPADPQMRRGDVSRLGARPTGGERSRSSPLRRVEVPSGTGTGRKTWPASSCRRSTRRAFRRAPIRPSSSTRDRISSPTGIARSCGHSTRSPARCSSPSIPRRTSTAARSPGPISASEGQRRRRILAVNYRNSRAIGTAACRLIRTIGGGDAATHGVRAGLDPLDAGARRWPRARGAPVRHLRVEPGSRTCVDSRAPRRGRPSIERPGPRTEPARHDHGQCLAQQQGRDRVAARREGSRRGHPRLDHPRGQGARGRLACSCSTPTICRRGRTSRPGGSCTSP